MSEQKLTFRSPVELLGMEFDESQFYFDDGIFALGQPFVILGPGGSGKSKLSLQMAACLLTGKQFLRWRVEALEGPILCVQAENHNHRLKEDLLRLKEWIGSDWQKVESGLLIHTLENEQDHTLHLDDHTAPELLAEAIIEQKPSIVIFDPLQNFTSGSLNTDSGMLSILRAVSQLSRLGDAHAAPIVLHHTLTGRDGMKKAIGFERASYGKGSKTLHAWARGILNIAPLEAGNSDRLVVGCGKNSNKREFEPFGIARNPKTGIYELDDGFDLEEWHAAIAGQPLRHRPKPESLASMVRALPKSKKALVEAIMTEYGCGRSNAYKAIDAAESAGRIRRNARKEYVAS